MPMTTLLTVPVSLEEIIRNYDVKDDPFTASDIARELNAARSAMIRPSHRTIGLYGRDRSSVLS